jgi:transcriptional regulator with XRE-family HTH domain
MENLGLRIKGVRLGMGLNQGAFAKVLNLGGAASISKFEKGQREPEIAVLVKIAKLANKNLDWLITGKSTTKPKPVEKKLGKIIAQVESIYREGNTKKLSAIQVLLDLASSQKPSRKRNKT